MVERCIYICVSKLGGGGGGGGVAGVVPSHYLNKCWLNTNWAPVNIFE